MQKQDFRRFAEKWDDAHEIMAGGKVFSQRSMIMIFDTLADYRLDAVIQAVNLHMKKSKFAPTPNDIIELLDAGNKRPTADEAWAMAPMDEFETTVWTREAAEAHNIARKLIADGDKIAARMTFKAAYERLCSEAVMMQRPVFWMVSIGCDKLLIEPVLQKAVLAGRISQDKANKYLPAPADSGVIAGLLTGKVSELPNNNENLKARWREIKQAISDGQKKLAEKERQRVLDAEQKRLEFERSRQDILNRVAQKLQSID